MSEVMHRQKTSAVASGTEAASFVDAARALACDRGLPKRWDHTAGVAACAEALARALAPASAVEDIVAAAWAHDIGYGPGLVVTGFHPIDGAGFLAGSALAAYGRLQNVTRLVAHHTGAIFEARERGLDTVMRRYALPAAALDLAILSCADLCTNPAGAPVDPGDRLEEVLKRYPPSDPVHRAITASAPLLLGQARLVLGAAAAAGCAAPHTQPGQRTDHQVQGPIGKPRALSQYRAFFTDTPARRQACVLAPGRTATTFQLDDVVRLHLDAATRGRSIVVQQRTFTTHSDATEWAEIAALSSAGPIDWPLSCLQNRNEEP